MPAGCRRIVLAGRHPDAMEPVAERLRGLGADVAVTAWDATDVDGHADAVKAAWDAAAGDVDCVVLAAACWATRITWPTDPERGRRPHHHQLHRPGLHPAARGPAPEEQGHGRIVVLSSVAGERVRRPTSSTARPRPASTASARAWATSGRDRRRARGGAPGFVHTSMTEGKDAPLLATTADGRGRRGGRRPQPGRRSCGCRARSATSWPASATCPARVAQAVGPDVRLAVVSTTSASSPAAVPDAVGPGAAGRATQA